MYNRVVNDALHLITFDLENSSEDGNDYKSEGGEASRC